MTTIARLPQYYGWFEHEADEDKIVILKQMKLHANGSGKTVTTYKMRYVGPDLVKYLETKKETFRRAPNKPNKPEERKGAAAAASNQTPRPGPPSANNNKKKVPPP